MKKQLLGKKLQELAENNGVGDFYRKIIPTLSLHFNSYNISKTCISFEGVMGKSRNVILSILPQESNQTKGICFGVFTDRFSDYFGIEKNVAINILPLYQKTDEYPAQGEYGKGYFRNISEFYEFLHHLSIFSLRGFTPSSFR